jgi:hypothetical protein
MIAYVQWLGSWATREALAAEALAAKDSGGGVQAPAPAEVKP